MCGFLGFFFSADSKKEFLIVMKNMPSIREAQIRRIPAKTITK